MVRVGGGWVALDEFLVKNDPCRGTYSNTVITYFTKHDVQSITYKLKTLIIMEIGLERNKNSMGVIKIW